MHTEISYENLDDPKTERKAIRDIQDFIGKGKKWDRLLIVVTAAISTGASMQLIHTICSFAGIQGYPVEALTKYITRTLGTEMPEAK